MAQRVEERTSADYHFLVTVTASRNKKNDDGRGKLKGVGWRVRKVDVSNLQFRIHLAPFRRNNPREYYKSSDGIGIAV
jgi:hypothetical protein